MCYDSGLEPEDADWDLAEQPLGLEGNSRCPLGPRERNVDGGQSDISSTPRSEPCDPAIDSQGRKGPDPFALEDIPDGAMADTPSAASSTPRSSDSALAAVALGQGSARSLQGDVHQQGGGGAEQATAT